MARSAHASLRPQVLHQLFFQYSPRLDEQAAVNDFVGHLHAPVVGILRLQPPGNLFRRPVQNQFTRNHLSQPRVHWEGDLLSGAKNSYIATLVERHSRFAMLLKVPSKETEAVVAALSQHVRKLPATLRRSLTWDRGLEMAKHKDFTVATNVQVYFCDPQSPWQRGTNENTNLLLRQYFPRGTDLSPFLKRSSTRSRCA
jgi:Integrase core domain